jgi:hypothetical protein
LKKTEDVIRAELRLPGHARTPFRGAKERVLILVNFLKFAVTFFAFEEFHTQANTRPISRPPSG